MEILKDKKLASSTMSNSQRLGIQNPSIQKLMPPVSTDSDDSRISDAKEPEIPISEDPDYHNSLPLPIQPAISRSPKQHLNSMA